MKVLLVTGLSGSGKSTAVKCLEDLGYFCIDNLPVPMIPSLFDLPTEHWNDCNHVAIVVDSRDAQHISLLPALVHTLRQRMDTIEILFLEGSDGILRQRFSETRRRHPLSPNGTVEDGIKKEKALLEPLKEISFVLNTSAMNDPELKRFVHQRYSLSQDRSRMSIIVQSFGFKHGIPLNADLVFDVRFLRNPFFETKLRSLTGLDQSVARFVLSQKDAETFLSKVRDMLTFLISCYEKEGKSYLHIAIGCTGGQHRSVSIVEAISSMLSDMGYQSKVEHREIERNRIQST